MGFLASHAAVGKRIGCGTSGGGFVILPPNIFSVTPNDQFNRLAWGASNGATSYDVYRSQIDSFGSASVIATDEVDTTYDDTSGNTGTRYFYWIVAKAGAVESDPTSSQASRAYVVLEASETLTLQTPPGSWTFVTVFFASGAIANNSTIANAGNSYLCFGGVWYNAVTFDDASDTTISGAFDITNQGGSPVTLWNGEP